MEIMIGRFLITVSAAMLATRALCSTPAPTVTLTTNGTSQSIAVDATQGQPITVMVAAPQGGTIEIDGAPTPTGPWTPIQIVITNAGSNTFNATTNTLSTTWAGLTFTLPYQVPFLRMKTTSLSGTATMGVVQPVIK